MPDGSFGNFGSVVPAPENPDLEIGAYCTAILRLRQASMDLIHVPAPGSPSEIALNKTWSQLADQQRRMVRHMCRLRAKTLEGNRMRALVVDAWFARSEPPGYWEEEPDVLDILSAMVRDLLASPNGD